MPDEAVSQNALGAYLRVRRQKLDPTAFGFPTARRRTPGLRREEVAQRANISPTWYTWLEQGRGGAPSADVLDRIARALLLTDIEREHLFLIGLGHAPEVRYREAADVTPRLQRILDALDPVPALIRSTTWDVLAWNKGAAVVLMDYGNLPREERNSLRYLFLNPAAREVQEDWESVARFVVGTFRIDAARAGPSDEIERFVTELCRLSPEFDALWRDNTVQGPHGDGVKRIRHPALGSLSFEFSVFAVDGRPDLNMTVYNPTEPEMIDRIARLVAEISPHKPG